MIIKRFNKKKLKEFTDKYEIKCSKVVVELVENTYFITIDNNRTFAIDYKLIKEFI